MSKRIFQLWLSSFLVAIFATGQTFPGFAASEDVEEPKRFFSRLESSLVDKTQEGEVALQREKDDLKERGGVVTAPVRSSVREERVRERPASFDDRRRSPHIPKSYGGTEGVETIPRDLADHVLAGAQAEQNFRDRSNARRIREEAQSKTCSDRFCDFICWPFQSCLDKRK
jgi:hypothetical protein